MKQKIKLPLFSIYSLIQKLEEMSNNPVAAEEHKELLSALGFLKESFMPLINEFKDCNSMPDLDVTVDSERELDNKDIDWEQRKYELSKAAMQGRISALDKNTNYRAVMNSIAKDSIKMADTLINELKDS